MASEIAFCDTGKKHVRVLDRISFFPRILDSEFRCVIDECVVYTANYGNQGWFLFLADFEKNTCINALEYAWTQKKIQVLEYYARIFFKIRDTSAWNPAGFHLEFSYGKPKGQRSSCEQWKLNCRLIWVFTGCTGFIVLKVFSKFPWSLFLQISFILLFSATSDSGLHCLHKPICCNI